MGVWASRWWAASAAGSALVAIALVWALAGGQQPVRVGVLHSLSGTMAISESAVRDATLLAIEEINAAGGVLGRLIEPVVVDGKSDWPTFASQAERLIRDEKVAVVFGCWTSASRKTVRPVFEKYDHLLMYPVQYEGVEQSPNVVYLGAAPNQQIIPAVKWCLDHLGSRVFLVGSDYVFPRTANAIIRDQVTSLEGKIVGEAYLLLGTTDVASAVQQIVATRPSVILNTINGDTNVAFFRALRAAGITPAEIPTISFSVAEGELRTMDIPPMVGDFAAWNYFESLDTSGFAQRFKARYGRDRVTSDPMAAAYLGVYLWAQAAEQARTVDVSVIKNAILDRSMAAPGGIIYIDPATRHAWRPVRIGKIRGDGQFDVVWDSEDPIRPQPFPGYRTVPQWEQLLSELYAGWGNRWANPGARRP